MLLGVLERLGPGHAPFAHRGDDLEVRVERLEGDVEADLIVALAGAAVGDRLGAFLVGHIDHQLGDERPAQGGGERILAFVDRAGHQRRPDEQIDEQVAGVDGDGVDRPGLEGLLLDLLDVLALAQVAGEGDDVQVVFLADPWHHDGGVEAAAVGQHDFLTSHRRAPFNGHASPRTAVRGLAEVFLLEPLSSEGPSTLSTPFRLLLPRQLHTEMLLQAQAELPNECCGLLAGRIEAGVGRVECRYPFVNDLASPIEFNAEPHGMFRAFKDMRRRGLVELAIYHSHPSSSPLPSMRDRERNYSAEVMNLIIGLAATAPQVCAWWLTEHDFREASWEVVD